MSKNSELEDFFKQEQIHNYLVLTPNAKQFEELLQPETGFIILTRIKEIIALFFKQNTVLNLCFDMRNIQRIDSSTLTFLLIAERLQKNRIDESPNVSIIVNYSEDEHSPHAILTNEGLTRVFSLHHTHDEFVEHISTNKTN